APFEPNALFLPVTTSLLPNTIIFKALVDSGSTHCFINSRFVEEKNMTTYPINPIRLKLFDGSSSSHMITKAIDIPLQIAPGHITPFTFYVTTYARSLMHSGPWIQLAHLLQSID